MAAVEFPPATAEQVGFELPDHQADRFPGVSVIHHSGIKPDGEATGRSRTADLPLNKERMRPMMKAARARWKMENRIFRTLESESGDCNPGHDHGHGRQHPASVMACPCMPVFLMEQPFCPRFRKALEQQVRRKCMWKEMRLVLSRVIPNDWETPYRLPSDNGRAWREGCSLPNPGRTPCAGSARDRILASPGNRKRETGGQGPSISLAHPFCRSCKSGMKKINGN